MIRKVRLIQFFLCLVLTIAVFSLAQAVGDPMVPGKGQEIIPDDGDGTVNPFFDQIVEGDRSIASDGAHISGDATWTLNLNMPPDAQVIKAFLYQGWVWLDARGKRSVTLNGTPLSDPFDVLIGHDDFASSSRWDVTSLVTGPGDYIVKSNVVSGSTWNYGAVLIVIWTKSGMGCRRVMINDGCDMLSSTSGSTTFPTITPQAGTATMDVLVFGGEGTEPDTEIFFNGTSLGVGIISYDNAYTFDVTSLINPTNTTKVADYGDVIVFEGSVLTVPCFSETGSIEGKVKDAVTGDPIPKAIVIAIELKTKEKFKGVTNDDGIYKIPDLKPGLYLVLAIKKDYKPGVKITKVKAGEVTTVDFMLNPKPE